MPGLKVGGSLTCVAPGFEIPYNMKYWRGVNFGDW